MILISACKYRIKYIWHLFKFQGAKVEIEAIAVLGDIQEAKLWYLNQSKESVLNDVLVQQGDVGWGGVSITGVGC